MAYIEQKRLLRRECEGLRDPELIELTLTGQPVAYDVLVMRHRTRVEAATAQFLRGADKEDCVQETFLKGLVNLPHLRSRESFGPWLAVIARNICIDTLKHNAPVVPICDEPEPDTVREIQLSSDRLSPLAEYIQSCDTASVRLGMSRLEKKYQLVLSMRYFDDCDYATIAHKLNKPLGTIKSLIHRGHERLRELMLEGAIQSSGAVVN